MSNRPLCRSLVLTSPGSPTFGVGLGTLFLIGAASLVGCEASSSDNPVASHPLMATTPAEQLQPPTQVAAIDHPEPAAVNLDGQSLDTSVTMVEPGRPRVYSRAPRLWIHEKPDRRSPRLGYLRAGGSAPVLETQPGDRVCESWVRIEPAGHVCVGKRGTLDHTDPIVGVFEEHPPDFSARLPYAYGVVRNPGPVFSKLLPRETLTQAEPGVLERMPRWLEAGGEIGAAYAQEVWARGGDLDDPTTAWNAGLTRDVPSFLQDGNTLPRFGTSSGATSAVVGSMMPRSGHAFLNTFFWEGRRYGITTGLELMPTDRFRPIRGSDFHGYRIGKDVKFPFALVRSVAAKFRSGASAPYRAALPLTGKQRFFDGVLHYETTDEEWISDRHASRVEPAKNMPGWGKNGEKWIDVNLSKQTLMLYEGTEPVFATLVSTGEAGLAEASTTTATKRGIFRIHTKHVTATMSSNEIGEEFELNDVPYVQYFDKQGYALHGAYWHDRFGMPKSHGCINLSPEDARRVFHWTEPRVPAGWHGALSPLNGTVLFVHP